MAQVIVAELRPHLQACSVFLTIEAGFLSQKKMKITIKPSSIIIVWASGSCSLTQKIILQGCRLVPNTLSCLQAEDEFISFRLQTEPLDGCLGSFSTQILPLPASANGPENEKYSSIASNVASGRVCQFNCRCCGLLLSEKKFQRILPLPSGPLDSSEWFCHDHSHRQMPFSLTPSAEDLFYGSCFFVLSLQSLLPIALSSSYNQVVRCKRCLAWLGTRGSSQVTLWDCTVSLEGYSYATPLQDFVKVVAEAVTSCVGLMCRVIVETQLTEKESHYLLLWIIDKNLRILTNFGSPAAFELKDNHPVGETLLQPRNTVKLLYLYQPTRSSLVKAWQDDVNIQNVDVAKCMFTEGFEYLSKMTKCIPRAYRVTNNYLTAYLDL